jgi:hypothetical protein
MAIVNSKRRRHRRGPGSAPRRKPRRIGLPVPRLPRFRGSGRTANELLMVRLEWSRFIGDVESAADVSRTRHGLIKRLRAPFTWHALMLSVCISPRRASVGRSGPAGRSWRRATAGPAGGRRRAGSTRHELTLIARAATRNKRQAAARPQPNPPEGGMRSRLVHDLGHHAGVLDE